MPWTRFGAVRLRNSWKFSFDRLTGAMWIGDIGPGAWEEVNYQPAGSAGGKNYGWVVREGFACTPNNEQDCHNSDALCALDINTHPVLACTHISSVAQSGRSITGGYAYRGCRYPRLPGYYIMADYLSDHISALDWLGNAIFFNNEISGIVSFGEDKDGELYFCRFNFTDLSSSWIYKMKEASAPLRQLLTPLDMPLSGVYDAIDTTTLTGEIEISDMDTVTFMAPTVILGDDVKASTSASVKFIEKCNN